MPLGMVAASDRRMTNSWDMEVIDGYVPPSSPGKARLEARGWPDFPNWPQLPWGFRSPRKLPGGYCREGRQRPPREFGVRAGNPPGGSPSRPPGLIPGDLG